MTAEIESKFADLTTTEDEQETLPLAPSAANEKYDAPAVPAKCRPRRMKARNLLALANAGAAMRSISKPIYAFFA
jgi:hypothetical protein